MRFHGITMVGKFTVEKVASLPTWSIEDEGRILYDTSEGKLFVGTDYAWAESGSGGYGTPVTNFTDNDVLKDGKMYFIDTSSGSLTGNMDPSPSIGDTVTVIDIGGSFELYSFVINGNGNNVNEDTSLELDVKNVILVLVWTGVSWKMDIGGIVQGTSVTNVTNTYDTSFAVTPDTGSNFYIDTRSNAVDITLPDEVGLQNGTKITIKDQYNTFSTNPVTVTAPTGVFENGTSSVIISSNGANISYIWNSGTGIWEKESISSGVSVGEVKTVTGDTNVDKGQFVFTDTSSGPVTITLPPDGQMVSGDVISVIDQNGTFGTNPVTINPAYGTINGQSSYICNNTNARLDFIWDAENSNWKLNTGGDVTKTIKNSVDEVKNVESGGTENAKAKDFIFVDTSSGSSIVNLPSSGMESGDIIIISDQNNTFGTNPVTINPDYGTINGQSSYTSENDGDLLEFIWDAENSDWKLNITGNEKTEVHDNSKHTENYVADTDSRLSDARTPVQHNNSYHSDNYALETRNITAGAGLNGGGDLTSDKTLSVDFGNSAGTVCAGDDSRLDNIGTVTMHDNSQHSDNYALETRNIIAGAGLNGGGDLTSDKTLSVKYGTTAGTACQGDDPRLSSPVEMHNNDKHSENYTPETRNIVAGTGLSGGGDLTSDKTLNVIFGDTSTEVCRGNDARLSDPRTPVIHNNDYHSETYVITSDSRLDNDRTRKISISASIPSGGSDGDMWFQY